MTKPMDPMYKLPTKELTRWAVLKVLRQYAFEPISLGTLMGIRDLLMAGGYRFSTIEADTRHLIFRFFEGRKPMRVGYTCKAVVPYADWVNS
jgi:hypothetical protein